MRPEVPTPSPTPPGPPSPEPAPAPADRRPREEGWPPDEDRPDEDAGPWPAESEGALTPWPDECDSGDPGPEPWPAGPGVEPPPEDLFPDLEDPTDPAFDLPDDRDPCAAPVPSRRVLGLREEVVLTGGLRLVALCDTGRTASVLAARLDTTGAAPTLHLRGGAVLPARPTSSGGVLLDLVIAGLTLPGVHLELAPSPEGPELILARDLLAGRFLVDPAGS